MLFFISVFDVAEEAHLHFLIPIVRIIYLLFEVECAESQKAAIAKHYIGLTLAMILTGTKSALKQLMPWQMVKMSAMAFEFIF